MNEQERPRGATPKTSHVYHLPVPVHAVRGSAGKIEHVGIEGGYDLRFE